jgi:uncharacterized membrane protein YvbJ
VQNKFCMALINCPECGREISDKATVCPHCGVVINSTSDGNQNSQSNQMNSPQQEVQPPVCPKTWLVESILVTLLCCLPFGIVGIVYSSKVSSKFDAKLYDEAKRASDEAGKWTKIGFFCGIGIYVIYFIVMLLAGGFAALASY